MTMHSADTGEETVQTFVRPPNMEVFKSVEYYSEDVLEIAIIGEFHYSGILGHRTLSQWSSAWKMVMKWWTTPQTLGRTFQGHCSGLPNTRGLLVGTVTL